MAAKATVKAGELIRATRPGRKQPRIYFVTKVTKGVATLQLAWAESGKTFPVLGRSFDVRVTELAGVAPYSPEGE